MGNNYDVDGRKSIDIDLSLRTRDHQKVLESIMENRVHEDNNITHLDQYGRMTQ